MTLRSELEPHILRRIHLVNLKHRTDEEHAELERLTTLLAAALPVRNVLAFEEDERPTRPEGHGGDDDA